MKNDKDVFVGMILLILAIVGAVFFIDSGRSNQSHAVNNGLIDFNVSKHNALFFMSVGCLHCQHFINDTLSNDTVMSKLKEMNLIVMTTGITSDELISKYPIFENVSIITDDITVKNSMNSYNVMGVPTIIIKSNENKVYQITGYRNVTQMIEIMDTIK